MNWWRFVVAAELRKILAYRSDFWVTFIGQTLIQFFIARALWSSLYEAQGVTEMNGYSLELMTLYYLIVPIGSKILVGPNVGHISREIYDGTFSRYLIYPLSPFQYKGLTYFTNSLFYYLQLVLILGLVMLFWYHDLTIANVLAGATLYLAASVVYCLIQFCIELISLWADNIWSLAVILRFATNFLGGGLVPLSFFPAWSLEALRYTPFPYFVSLPVRTIMGQATPAEIGQGLVILAFWYGLTLGCLKLMWNRGQLRFTGAGQ